MSLEYLYSWACGSPSDINEHVPRLRELASCCDHVTEFGVRHGVSTIGLLYAQPKTLISYDVNRYPEVDRLYEFAGETHFEFHLQDVLCCEIDATDMLFIDTRHTYDQVKEELRLHSAKVKRWLSFHDTTIFGERGEDGGAGLWPAIEEFIGQGDFFLLERRHNNNGFTVLERKVSNA